MTRLEKLSQVMVGPTKPPMEVRQTPDLMGQDDGDHAPDQHDRWDDADVFGLIDPEAFRHFSLWLRPATRELGFGSQRR